MGVLMAACGMSLLRKSLSNYAKPISIKNRQLHSWSKLIRMDPIGSHKVWRRPRLVPVSFGEPKHPKQNFGIVSVDCPLSTHVPQPSGNHEFKTRRQLNTLLRTTILGFQKIYF